MTEPRPRRRWSLAARIALASVAVAVLTAVIAGALAVGLVDSSGNAAARRTFADLADVVQAGSTNPNTGRVVVRRLRDALQGLSVRDGILDANGVLTTQYPLVRDAVSPADIGRLHAGHSVSAVRHIDGSTVFLEGRPVGSGAIVLVQRESDATRQSRDAVRRSILALLIAGALAAVIGLFVAWRLARPLRRTAEAARALAAGQRDVLLPVGGAREVAEVSEAVNSLAAELRTSEGRQRDFLLSVSHDLRTPLTVINGYAESLADGVVPAAQVGAVGTVLHGEAQRLQRLVGDLLDLARLGARDFRVELRTVDVTEFAAATAPVWAARCTAAQLRFHLDAPDGPRYAHTDAARLRQILDGLLDNALRVVPADAPVVLAVRADPPGAAAPAAIVVEVRDGGPGLTDDDLAVAFDQGALHERYRGVRQVGTGLGLAIVHGLVLRLGGRIEAGHAMEGGARFTVYLPCAPDAGGHQPGAGSHR